VTGAFCPSLPKQNFNLEVYMEKRGGKLNVDKPGAIIESSEQGKAQTPKVAECFLTY
jgi:hypothetical protein